MHQDEYDEAIFKLVKATDTINELDLPKVVKHLQSRITKLKFSNTTIAKKQILVLETMLALVRAASVSSTKFKRPLRTLHKNMPGLNQVLNSQDIEPVDLTKSFTDHQVNDLTKRIESKTENENIVIIGGDHDAN